MVRRSSTLSGCALAALGCVTIGCGASSPPLAPLSENDGTRTIGVAIGPVRPQAFVAVVDDGPDATALRATLARTFEQMDAIGQMSSPSCFPPFDPAAFHPVDRTLLVVHPSASGSDRYTTELDLPNLRWQSNQRTDAEHAAWADAVAHALEPKSRANGSFEALAAFERVASLASRTREPEDDGEAGILESLDPRAETALIAALAHEDESPGDPTLYQVPLAWNLIPGIAILPDASPSAADAGCYDGTRQGSARYEDWADAQGFLDVGHWPCTDSAFVPPLSGDCTHGCPDFSPVLDADGSAACRVLVRTSPDAPCDEAFGWLDPMQANGERAPQVVREEGFELRVCEIRQLSGSALDSCVNSLECPDCEPGWCVTRIPELDECAADAPNTFRFVGGSDRAAPGHGQSRCTPVATE